MDGRRRERRQHTPHEVRRSEGLRPDVHQASGRAGRPRLYRRQSDGTPQPHARAERRLQVLVALRRRRKPAHVYHCRA